MKALPLLVFAASAASGCAEDAATAAYHFRATVDAESAMVAIDGVPSLSIDETYPDFATAQAELNLPAHITLGSMMNDTFVRPGYCAETANRLGLDLGKMRLEDVTLVVTATLTLHAGRAHCEGSLDGFTQEP